MIFSIERHKEHLAGMQRHTQKLFESTRKHLNTACESEFRTNILSAPIKRAEREGKTQFDDKKFNKKRK